MMEFCSKCGAILVPKKSKSGDQAMLILACNKWGQKVKEKDKDVKVRGKTIEHSSKQLVSVINKENQLKHSPSNTGYLRKVWKQKCICLAGADKRCR